MFAIGRSVFRNFSTINKQEMQQFDKMSEWWKPDGPMSMLYKYNYERVQFLKAYFIKNHQSNLLFPFEKMKILDVGCGAGFLTKSLSRLGAQVIGLDPNKTSFKEATQHKIRNNSQFEKLKYYNSTLQEYLLRQDCSQKQFDIVTSMDVIQHVDNPKNFLNSIYKATKPNGIIMVSTIAQNPITWFTHIFMAEYVTKIVPKDTHHYDKFINPRDLQSLIRQQGAIIIDRKQLSLSWKGQFKDEQGGSNYIILAQKPAS